MVYWGAWGKLIHEKNQKSKISWHCPFKDTAEIATEVTEKANWDQANELVWFEEMERKWTKNKLHLLTVLPQIYFMNFPDHGWNNKGRRNCSSVPLMERLINCDPVVKRK